MRWKEGWMSSKNYRLKPKIVIKTPFVDEWPFGMATPIIVVVVCECPPPLCVKENGGGEGEGNKKI